MCQDTGTAIVMGKRGRHVLTDGADEAAIARGVFDAYTRLNLRYSQLAPLTMWDERNTGSNLPAQIELYAEDPDGHPDAYKFLFMAKGGGSANKSLPLPGDQGAAEPDPDDAVPGGEAAPDRHRRLPALPPGDRHRRHLGRVRAEDRQVRLGEVPRRPADVRIACWRTASATSSWRPRCWS